MPPIETGHQDAFPSREESEQRLATVHARIGSLLRDQTLAQWWTDRATQAPSRAFLATDAGSLSYAEVDRLAERVSRAAIAAGLGAGDVAAIQLTSGPAFLALILGLARVGARMALLSPELRGRSLRHALDAVPPLLVFTTTAGRARILELDTLEPDRIVALSEAEPSRAGDPADDLARLEGWLAAAPDDAAPATPHEPRSQPTPDDTLFYIFTSGTTGLPKATQCSHRRYLAGAASEAALLEMTESDCMLVVLPMFHIAALSAIGAAMCVSASVVIRPKFSASRFWDDVRKFSATTFQYLGEILRYLLAQPAQPNDRDNTVRALIGAGITTRVWREFEERFGPKRIIESYGSSEGVIGMFNLDGVAGSVGRPAPALEARLRIVRCHDDAPRRGANGRLEVCSEDEPGELIARLDEDNRFEGYSSEDATKSKLIEDAFDDGDLWYRSGDLFRQRAGYYFFERRLGDTYRWKGENVSTQQVADAIRDTDGVANAVVYGVRVPDHEGSAGMALISLDGDRDFDGRGLFAQLSAELPAAALPLFVRVGDGRGVLTETLKIGTAKLAQQGYGATAAPDPRHVLDAAAGRYVPLDTAALERLGLPEFDAGADLTSQQLNPHLDEARSES